MSKTTTVLLYIVLLIAFGIVRNTLSPFSMDIFDGAMMSLGVAYIVVSANEIARSVSEDDEA